ncbi:MAG TPA: 2Fe-2S iron-sulfur cluster binding domain-containing protein [Candidatus Eisenbergiella stercorigallinarum]|uniref:2Fe-2S iron-sulfur cluster binding domain-containing protein n=1 Tax=Candidatus Eisenbergiella stercorigallinarum TaxID=2838557 RepID=A0A9D2TY54_9FIRM|nr:2Fe-2S iron-sulfur cluster binding domain-containing protein [Candidatus Eisenbergiella stercorigallinarum]
MSEYEVTVRGGGKEEKRIQAPSGALFLQLLKGNGYPLVCCNGKGGCGRCRIRFVDGDAPRPAPSDKNALTARDLEEGVRLACVHRVERSCRIRVEFVPPGEKDIGEGG